TPLPRDLVRELLDYWLDDEVLVLNSAAWRCARVIDVSRSSGEVRIHFMGWNSVDWDQVVTSPSHIAPVHAREPHGSGIFRSEKACDCRMCRDHLARCDLCCREAHRRY